MALGWVYYFSPTEHDHIQEYAPVGVKWYSYLPLQCHCFYYSKSLCYAVMQLHNNSTYVFVGLFIKKRRLGRLRGTQN